jgi:hypothetical protein
MPNETTPEAAEELAGYIRLNARLGTYAKYETMLEISAMLESLARQLRSAQAPLLARNQPCGCIVCICEDEVQCHGCGAKDCGTHPSGEIPNPLFQDETVRIDKAEADKGRAALAVLRALNTATSYDSLTATDSPMRIIVKSSMQQWIKKFCYDNGLAPEDLK